MRFKLARGFLCLLTLAACVTVALPGYASAGNGNGKIGPRLQAELAVADPNSDLPVLVLGGNPGAAVGRHNGRSGAALDLIGGVAATMKAKDVASLADDSDVGHVSADVPMAPAGSIDPSKVATLYPFVDGAPAAWAQNLEGSGVGVAVIDSGVRRQNDFASNLNQITVFGTTAGSDDTYGHGTLVAGVIAGKSNDGRFVGVAPGSKIYSLNVNKADGVHSSDVINALQWVFNNAHTYNIRVVNLSLQETVPSSYQMSLLDLAVERVWAAGIAVVVAAGNAGLGAADYAPANDPLALTVGASDTNDTLTSLAAASFSSSGTTVDGVAKPELLAPGRHIVAPLPKDTTLGQQAPPANWIAPGYASISGTSFSAPQVSGAAAILFQQHPDWSPDNVKWVLARVAQPVPGSLAGALSVSGATSYLGAPGLANQGVPALVCAPNTTCVASGTVGTVSSSWNSSSWNSSSWNSSSWNSSSWNRSSWNSSSWNSSSWNSSSWNSSSWNSSSWNSSSWNSTSWN